MLETTVAGSLPKPAWLATPKMLWAPWTLAGEALAEAKRDATVLAVHEQESCGIDIVSDGEQARQHFVHGFLAGVDGVHRIALAPQAADEQRRHPRVVLHDEQSHGHQPRNRTEIAIIVQRPS